MSGAVALEPVKKYCATCAQKKNLKKSKTQHNHNSSKIMTDNKAYKILCSAAEVKPSKLDVEFLNNYFEECLEVFLRHGTFFLNNIMPAFRKFKLAIVDKLSKLKSVNEKTVECFAKTWFMFFLETRDEVEVLRFGNLHRSYHQRDYAPYICPHFWIKTDKPKGYNNSNTYVTASFTGLQDFMKQLTICVS